MRAGVLSFFFLFLGCPGPKPDDTGNSPIDDTGETGETGQPECPTTGDVPDAPGCKAAGGVCVGAGTCEGGTLAHDYDSECAFDDGAGECCVPPAPASSGETCADLGGVCAPIAGCGMVNGWGDSTDDCGDWVGETCCVPQAVCGDIDATCCGDGWASTPGCFHGELACQVEEHELMCADDCPY